MHRVFPGLLLVCGAALAPAALPAATITVTIEAMQFSPRELTVHRGDRIVWVNKDPFPHTVTADGKAFDSKDIESGASWSYIASKPGEYAYSCAFHPTMKGSITVQ